MSAATLSVDGVLDEALEADSSGDWGEALRLYGQALENVQDEADVRRPMLMRRIGRVHFERGSYEEANRAFQTSLITAQEQKHRPAAAAALNAMAACAQSQGRLDIAESLYERAVALSAESGDVSLWALIELSLALRTARACEHPMLEAETESERARVFLAAREHRRRSVR